MIQITWCKFEGRIDNITDVAVLTSDQCNGGRLPREPSLVVMALDIKSHLNSNAGKNEIVIASGIVHTHGFSCITFVNACKSDSSSLSDHRRAHAQPGDAISVLCHDPSPNGTQFPSQLPQDY